MNWTKLLTFLWQVDTPTEKKAEPEPTFEILTNPARVVPAQEKFIKFLEESRYVPVKSAASGFVLLRDLRPTEPEVLSLTDAPSSTASTAAAPAAAHQGGSSSGAAMNVDEEPQPPQPFEYSTWCGFSFLKCLVWGSWRNLRYYVGLLFWTKIYVIEPRIAIPLHWFCGKLWPRSGQIVGSFLLLTFYGW